MGGEEKAPVVQQQQQQLNGRRRYLAGQCISGRRGGLGCRALLMLTVCAEEKVRTPRLPEPVIWDAHMQTCCCCCRFVITALTFSTVTLLLILSYYHDESVIPHSL